ncbi:MAG: hypothetical protein KGL31_06480 [candidate division NC10 bacterium]|nr:hypothetical protein [candidate division NC10 bacterium]
MMSGDGKNIVSLMQQLRKLCEQISLLLMTADSLMIDRGWRAETAQPFAGLSYTLSSPRFWIPQDFSRFYKNNNVQHILGFVSVVLDDAEGSTSLDEPLLTAGWFDYGPGVEVGKRWQYSYARWHLKMPQRSDDGRLLPASSTIWPKEPLPFLQVSTLGVPLTSILDAEALKSKIVEPLIQGIKGAQGR